ncbi:MAG TPA: 3-isopropylmalate dehydrogenase [Polyangia bacterium]|nr:3-isopropylmalate dehydrogenase [Polyangia bacterium]
MVRVAVFPGDGIGPEVTEEAIATLRAAGARFGLACGFESCEIGGAAIERHGVPLPEPALALAQSSDAVLLGAVGGPRWDGLPSVKRPERALLGLRKAMAVYANLRPARVYDALADASTLKPEVVRGVDLIVVRELCGGIYFGQPRGVIDECGINTEVYTGPEIERIARVAFRVARERPRCKVTSVDKANVLESSELWRRVVQSVHDREFSEIALEHMLVDNCAMQLVRAPRQFDVILTTNLFGDILSDEAAMLTGSIGMLPSASLGEGRRGLYEPVHGSAPDIAGQGRANPLAAILSVALLARHSLARADVAHAIESAVERVLADGARSADLGGSVSTSEMGQRVRAALG